MKKKIFAILIAVALLAVGLSAIPIMADPANGQMTHVKLTPENAAMVTGTTQRFTVQALDNNNQPVTTNVSFFWLVAEGDGSINSTGLFTAGTKDATVEVIAALGKIVKSATAEVKVEATLGTLDHIKVTPATANVLPSGTQQFTAQGYDALGVAVSTLAPTWTTTATGPTGTGSIDSSGKFSAGTGTGTAIVTATVSGKSDTATVNVTTTTTTTTTPTTTPTENNNKSSLFSMLKRYLKGIGSDNFMGGTWQVKNSSGTTDTYNLISGVVQTVSGTTLNVLPNGQTTAIAYTPTATTVIQPKDAVFAANDNVIILTVNNQVTMISKITADSTTQLPPGLKKQDNNNRQGKDTPPGWSQGKKNGWNKDSSNGGNGSNSNGD